MSLWAGPQRALVTGSEGSARLGLGCVFLLFELKVCEQLNRCQNSQSQPFPQLLMRGADLQMVGASRQGCLKQNSVFLQHHIDPPSMFSELIIRKCGVIGKDNILQLEMI